jgi:SOS regulatory protein LexA
MVSSSLRKPTPRQKEILGQIRNFHRREGYFPSIRELSAILHIRSSNTTFSHIRALLQHGLLKKNNRGQIIACQGVEGREASGSAISAKQVNNDETLTRNIVYFPSGVPAGFQAPAEDAGRETLSVDQYLIKNPQNTFALKVKGNSMENAGIMPNDLLLVEKKGQARPGQIVVARLPDGFTVKRLAEENGQLFLQAESSREYRIPLEEGTEIWGIVIGVIRKY